MIIYIYNILYSMDTFIIMFVFNNVEMYLMPRVTCKHPINIRLCPIQGHIVNQHHVVCIT